MAKRNGRFEPQKCNPNYHRIDNSVAFWNCVEQTHWIWLDTLVQLKFYFIFHANLVTPEWQLTTTDENLTRNFLNAELASFVKYQREWPDGWMVYVLSIHFIRTFDKREYKSTSNVCVWVLAVFLLFHFIIAGIFTWIHIRVVTQREIYFCFSFCAFLFFPLSVLKELTWYLIPNTIISSDSRQYFFF